MRPIDADALMKAMYHRAFETDGDTMWQSGCWVRYRAIEQVVKEQPTTDVQPVRHERWNKIDVSGLATCGCGYITDRYSAFNYCPHCGARMECE